MVIAAKELANNLTKTNATRNLAKKFNSLESGSGVGIISDDASTEQELDKRTSSRIGASDERTMSSLLSGDVVVLGSSGEDGELMSDSLLAKALAARPKVDSRGTIDIPAKGVLGNPLPVTEAKQPEAGRKRPGDVLAGIASKAACIAGSSSDALGKGSRGRGDDHGRRD